MSQGEPKSSQFNLTIPTWYLRQSQGWDVNYDFLPNGNKTAKSLNRTWLLQKGKKKYCMIDHHMKNDN
eukprot:13519306-Ditylum_brightwellii.AAC.1